MTSGKLTYSIENVLVSLVNNYRSFNKNEINKIFKRLVAEINLFNVKAGKLSLITVTLKKLPGARHKKSGYSNPLSLSLSHSTPT